jgi:hypothetical protein
MMVHLNEKRLRALLDGRLSLREETRLARHLLDDECQACEEFLGGLDESVEKKLFEIWGRSARAGDLPAEARKRVLDAVSSVPRTFLVPAAGFALVALLVLAIVLWFTVGEDETRVKGNVPDVVGVELSLGVVEAGKDGAVEVRRIASGADVTPESQVVFRATTEGPCYLYLVRVGPDGLEVLVPDHFDEPLRHTGGAYTPMAGGKPAGYALEGNAGVQHFVAVCSEKPLAALEDLQPLAERLWKAGEPDRAVDVVSYDVVTLRVLGEGKTR